uniref:Translocation protein SEC62 n=1 Tax=Angiostrongylus cantonensis TaxID=6313 RepID=A0A0K0D045_ANGCA
LEVHDVQVFSDDKDVYVWVFDPTPLYKKVIGLLMVLGTILGCLFPLWPAWLRQGVYYLSLAGIAAFGAIVIVAILRTVLFGVIWLFTMGRHKLWILPNLTEVSFFLKEWLLGSSYFLMVTYGTRGARGALVGDATAMPTWNRSLCPWPTEPSICPRSAIWYQTCLGR